MQRTARILRMLPAVHVRKRRRMLRAICGGSVKGDAGPGSLWSKKLEAAHSQSAASNFFRSVPPAFHRRRFLADRWKDDTTEQCGTVITSPATGVNDNAVRNSRVLVGDVFSLRRVLLGVADPAIYFEVCATAADFPFVGMAGMADWRRP